MCCTLTLYGYALSVLDGRRQLTSAAWREILGELYPDAPKSAERITESEVVPRWADTMHADDVTKNINWFQAFCRIKYGMDDHVPFFWRCNIADVQLEWERSERLSLDPAMNCSAAFVKRHIIDGDDPRCVPWGERSLEMLAKLQAAEGDAAGAALTESIDPMFDEYTVHKGTPLSRPLKERLDFLDSSIADLKDLVGQLRPHGRRTAADGRVDSVDSVESVESADRSGKKSSEELGRTRPGLSSKLERQSRKVASQMRTAMARRQRGRRLHWYQAARDGFRDPDGFCTQIRDGCPSFKGAPDVDEEEVNCRCFSGDMSNSFPAMNTCRNHHWGLAHLCRPREIVIDFEIRRISCSGTRPLVRCTPMYWFMTKMTFTPINDLDGVEPSGWYNAALQLDEGKCFGFILWYEGIIGLAAILSLFWFLLQGPLWSVLCLPRNVHHVLQLRGEGVSLRDEQSYELESLSPQCDTDAECVLSLVDVARISLREEFERRYGMVLSGKGKRATYMARTDVFAENVAGVFVVCGFLQSTLAIQEKDIKSPDSRGDANDTNAWDYLRNNFTGTQLIIEVLYQVYFDESTYHTLAWFIMFMTTILAVFDSLEGLQWLPAILRLSAARLSYFLLAYSLVIFGFGLVFWIQFGARFIQFSSLARAWYELFFLSCGVPFHVFDDINPTQDNDSWHLSLFLALYLIVAVIVSLNFFTTIILDAYSLAKDPRESDLQMSRIRYNMNEALMNFMGIGVLPDSDSDSSFDPFSGVLGILHMQVPAV